MLLQHSMSIAQQLMPIYNIILHKNKSYGAINVGKLLVLWYTNMPQVRKSPSDYFSILNDGKVSVNM